MKIKMLTERYFPIWGGAENQLRQLLPYLSREGFHVEVITRRWRKEMQRTEYIDGTMVRRIGIPGEGLLPTILFVLMLGVYLIGKSPSIDVIHTHGAVAMAALGRFFAMITGKVNVAKIATAGRILKYRQSLTGRVILFWFKRSDAIICMSDEVLEELANTNVPSQSIFRIENAVDGNRFKPMSVDKRKEWRSKRGFEEKTPLVIFSGRLVPRKGLDILIDAWCRVIKKYPDTHLLIIGSGNFQPDSIETQMQLKVDSENIGNIHFEGETDSPESYLGVADIFVFPSRREGFPNALLEAMASGLSPVASEIGGVVDLIKNGKTGLLFPPEDSQTMADKIQFLLNNPEVRVRIGQKARTHVLENYTFDRVAEQYCQLYENIHR